MKNNRNNVNPDLISVVYLSQQNRYTQVSIEIAELVQLNNDAPFGEKAETLTNLLSELGSLDVGLRFLHQRYANFLPKLQPSQHIQEMQKLSGMPNPGSDPAGTETVDSAKNMLQEIRRQAPQMYPEGSAPADLFGSGKKKAKSNPPQQKKKK